MEFEFVVKFLFIWIQTCIVVNIGESSEQCQSTPATSSVSGSCLACCIHRQCLFYPGPKELTSYSCHILANASKFPDSKGVGYIVRTASTDSIPKLILIWLFCSLIYHYCIVTLDSSTSPLVIKYWMCCRFFNRWSYVRNSTPSTSTWNTWSDYVIAVHNVYHQ